MRRIYPRDIIPVGERLSSLGKGRKDTAHMIGAARALVIGAGALLVVVAVLNVVDTFLGPLGGISEVIFSLILVLTGGALAFFGTTLIRRNPAAAGVLELILGLLLCLLGGLAVIGDSTSDSTSNSYVVGLLTDGLLLLAGIFLVVGGIVSFVQRTARPGRIG